MASANTARSSATSTTRKIVDWLRRLFWMRSYEVAFVPAGANGIPDFLDGVKSLGPDDAQDAECCIRLGEALTALGVGLKSATTGQEGIEHAIEDAMDAVLSEMEEMGKDAGGALAPIFGGKMGNLIPSFEEGIAIVEMEAYLMLHREPETGTILLQATKKMREMLPDRAADGIDGEKGKPASGKPGGHKTPPKGYPTNPNLFLDPENWKYPCDTEARTRAAITYLSREKPGGPGGYTKEELAWMWARLKTFADKYEIKLSKDTGVKACEDAEKKETGGMTTDTKAGGSPEERTMSGKIKINMATPVTGGLFIGDVKMADLTESVEHVLENVPCGANLVRIVSGEKAAFEESVTVEEGKEVVIDVKAVVAVTAPSSIPVPVPALPIAAPAPVAAVAPVTSAETATAEGIKSLVANMETLSMGLATLTEKMGLVDSIKTSLDALTEKVGQVDVKATEAVTAATKAAANRGRTDASLLLSIPGTTQVVERDPKEAAGTKGARSDINEDDLGSSARIAELRKTLCKGGGFPPVM